MSSLTKVPKHIERALENCAGNTPRRSFLKSAGLLAVSFGAAGISPLVTPAVSRGRLNQIIAQVRLSSEYLWSCESVSDAIVEVSLLLYDLFGEYLWV